MKLNLYSKAHIQTAHKIFKNINQEWCEKVWTEDEINACKSIEVKKFIDLPSIINMPVTFSIKEIENNHEFKILEKYIKSKYIENFLSVGSGWSLIELALAIKNPNIQFFAIDNAPYIEGLNIVAKELQIKNIKFSNADLRNNKFGKFDIVYSMAIIYCINDEDLSNYFKILQSSTKKEGRIFVGCSSNLSLILKIRLSFKFLITKLFLIRNLQEKLQSKQTGYLRSSNYIKRFIPENLKIESFYSFNHNHSKSLIINKFSKEIAPISNTSYLYKLKLIES
jgi:hypothetical protein